ncbi:MAG: APC family permease [Candidatus Eisenbacteria bacterium]|uniref:APC family permease n=1 Tax=Eiseniibacteriota bacterium TaxID=2212470 RepID=A0A538TB96_UNCEI|nr:MAG: APC family permease [Candidatus Eisenbacteria bacterium]
MWPSGHFGARSRPRNAAIGRFQTEPSVESRTADLPRVLGLWDATSVVVGAIIGVGIFFNPRDVARVTGGTEAALLAWGIGGTIALLGAFTFAELGRLRPLAGGQYHVLRDAYGRPPAFLFVFCNLTAVQAGGVAIIAVVCAQNLGVALHGRDPAGPWVMGLATLLTWALVGVNVIGVRSGAGLQDATVIAKLVTLGALVALAAAIAPGHAALDAGPPAGAHALTFPMLFSVDGGRGGGRTSHGPARHRPGRGDRGGGVPARELGLLPPPRLPRGLRREDARRRRLLRGVARPRPPLNAQFLAGPRLTWAMARDGLFFPIFARLHARFSTPVPAILLLGVLSTGLTLGLGLERTDRLTTGVVVVDASFFALTGLALPILRRRERAADRGPAWIAGAAFVFAALELLAIAGSVLEQNARVLALSGLAWIGAAAMTWALFFRRAR